VQALGQRRSAWEQQLSKRQKTKKIAIVAAAALLVASPAFAQTATTLAPSTNDPSLPTESNSDFGVFVQGVGKADFTTSYDELDTATSVNIIKLSGMASASAKSFQDGFAGREADVANLRVRLEGNVIAMGTLEAAGLTLDDVVAIDADEDGVVTLYVNDLS
jgi:hypothetical protein